jgi:hypothetical protein
VFEESQKLDPAIGTQFKLADCYAHTARPATALALFRDVLRVAQLSGKQDRQRAAEERIAALEKVVPRLRIVLSEGAAAAFPKGGTDLVIRRDGVALRNDEIGEPMPVDPGAHVVSASAPNHVAWEAQVVASETPVEITVPMLVEIPRPAGRPRTSPLTYLGLGTAGLGVAAIGVGAVFGLVAVHGKNDAACSGVDCRDAPPGSAQKLRDAQTSATLSTVFMVTGAVLAAGGATLWFLAPKKSGVSASAAVAPGSASFLIERAF